MINDELDGEWMVVEREKERERSGISPKARKEKRRRGMVVQRAGGHDGTRGSAPLAVDSLYFTEALPDIPRTWCSVRRLG